MTAVKLLLLLALVSGCAGARPTFAPVGPAHWANVRDNTARRWVTATAVNSSTDAVVLDCTDARVVVPARTEVDVLIVGGHLCDLQPELVYGGDQ